MYTEEQRKIFSDVAESLKKYRRADLIDDNGKNLLDELYVDLLPGNFILEKSLYNNTTFLVGRKGTGKSTIFLKLENEYRKKNKYLPCYIDVKTVFESSKAESINHEYLENYISTDKLEKYLVQRNFIRNVLKNIYEEIEKKELSLLNAVQGFIDGNDKQSVKQKISALIERIDNNKHLQSIEIPIFQEIAKRGLLSQERQITKQSTLRSPELEVSAGTFHLGNIASSEKTANETKGTEVESSFNDLFLKVFEIKTVIEEVRKILLAMKIEHLVLLLDDVSEIDYFPMKTFIDSIVAPLNNWSNEFIKFKVAFYPGRIYYGDIDPGKIDVIHLDFYNLYSRFDATQMTDNAINFTARLIEARFKHYGTQFEKYVDTTKIAIHEYYELIFNVTMNVPRIIGYIFSYLYESNIVHKKKITKNDIEKASQRYFEEKIDAYFEKSVCKLLSYEETKSIYELKSLKSLISDRLSGIKTEITTGKLKGSLYDTKEPYTSHFYVLIEMEEQLNSLELNHYITKYDEKSDRDKNKISIYCLNYGLAYKNNILWGKKKHYNYRKYFIERPFNFSQLITNFLSKKEVIICSNDNCRKTFNQEDLQALKLYNMKCNSCSSEVLVTEVIDHEFKRLLSKIDTLDKLGKIEYSIMLALLNSGKPLFAREIAEEIDLSSYLIAARCKKLDKEKGYIIRSNVNVNGVYKYEISGAGKLFFEQANLNQ